MAGSGRKKKEGDMEPEMREEIARQIEVKKVRVMEAVKAVKEIMDETGITDPSLRVALAISILPELLKEPMPTMSLSGVSYPSYPRYSDTGDPLPPPTTSLNENKW